MSKPAFLMTAALFAGSMLCAPCPAEAAPAASEGEDSPASVRVVVDADALGEAEGFFETEALTRVRAALEQAGYRVTDKADADVTVRVRMSFYNEADLDYELDVDISAGAELVTLETVACPQCVDEDLLGRIDEHGEDVAGGVAQVLARVGGRDDGVDPAGEPNGDGDPEPQVAAVGGLGIGGGVLAGLGLGATIAGAVELSRGKVYDDQLPSPDPTRTYVDHRPPGVVLLSTGLVALTAGTAMLIADIVVRSKKRKQHQASLYPALGPAFVGLGYIQQF